MKVRPSGARSSWKNLRRLFQASNLGEELDAALAGLARQHVHLLQHRADVHELRHRHGLAVLVHEQVGAQRAVRMAAQGGGLLAAQRAEQLGERRDAGEREPVLVRVGDAGLLLDGVGEIGEREALGFQLVPRDAAGEGHRLEADAAGAFDVLQRQADDVADLVIVQALHDGGNEDDLQPGLLARSRCTAASSPTAIRRACGGRRRRRRRRTGGRACAGRLPCTARRIPGR